MDVDVEIADKVKLGDGGEGLIRQSKAGEKITIGLFRKTLIPVSIVKL